MKIGNIIDDALRKTKLNKISVSIEDSDLVDAAMKEINKMSRPENWGVINNTYFNKVANISFFAGAAVAVGVIALVGTGVKAVKKVIEDKSPNDDA